MKVLTSWLNEYLEDNLSAEQIAQAMELAGIEVEEIIHPPQFASGIIVAEIVAIKPHPNADKLQVATVKVPSGTQEVVCGATNIYVGQKAPYVAPLTTLPNNQVIETTEIRGVKSSGMLASERELGLGHDHNGIIDLDKHLAVGTPLNQVFDAAVIDITIAANRVDLLSVAGIAREVAVHSGVELTEDRAHTTDHKITVTKGSGTLFTNQLGEAVPRYLLAKVLLPKNKTSPSWLRHRLQASGVKPVNLVVDVTNYAMLEYGQPLHAFDAKLVEGEVVLRYAHDDEQLTTLDGVTRTLSSSDVLIADTKQPLALAGIMGGENSAVGADTKSILLESALFVGPQIRKSAQRHGVRTEASSRFERSLPLEFPVLGLARALELLEELGDAVVETVQDEMAVEEEVVDIPVSLERFSALSGVEVEEMVLTEKLTQLGFTVEKAEQPETKFIVKSPFWRPDVRLSEDVLEEVVKLIGLDQIPATLPTWNSDESSVDHWLPYRFGLRNALVGLGLFEVMTYPFVSPGSLELLGLDENQHLKLKNPRSQEQQYLRTTPAPSLLDALASNSRRREEFGLFEIARTYHIATKSGEDVDENTILGVVVQAHEPYRRVKNILDNLERSYGVELHLETARERSFLHPARQIEIFAGSEPLGYIGEVHPSLGEQLKLELPAGYLELDIKQLFALKQPTSFTPLSRFQTAKRDVTVLIKQQIRWADIEKSVADSGLAEASYIGDYYGEGVAKGQRALTLHLEFGDPDKTLTDKEVEDRLNAVLKLLEDSFAAELQE